LRAGLRKRDIIVAVNDRSVATVDDIHRSLAGQPAGTPVTLTVLRDGQRREVHVISDEV